MNKRCIVGEILLEDGFLQRRRRLCQMLDNSRYIGHYKDEQEINTEDQSNNAPGFSILIKDKGSRFEFQGSRVLLESEEAKDINLGRDQDIKSCLPVCNDVILDDPAQV